VGCELSKKAMLVDKFPKVWSELCGMWTAISSCNALFFCSSLIWTMWDVNLSTWPQIRLYTWVWSELCGMWTCLNESVDCYGTNKFDLNYVGCELITHKAFYSLKIKFDLNYVGCERRR